LLAFVAEHRIVLAAHVQALIGASDTVTYGRLRALTKAGLLEHSRVLHGEPGWYQITRGGLAMIGSDLPSPRLDLRCYAHDIGVAWLWLAASRGAFGPVERMVSEREMRSHDGRHDASPREGGSPFGIPLGGVGPRGRDRLHYPDLLLVGGTGERVAIELELSAKGARRLETILLGYAADRRISAVLYLAEKPAIRREVRAAAARLGVSDLVHVQSVAWPATSARDRAAERTAARAPLGRQRPVTREAIAR
jgi:DNA-binding PadR family transcriptional regulator